MKNKINKILFLSIIINLITVPIAIYMVVKKMRHVQTIDKISVRTINKSELFNFLDADSKSIFFIGNSITERMPWTELFNDLNIKNRGIGGDRSDSVVYRINNMAKKKPKKIFLMLGINDLMMGKENLITIKNYETIINSIRTISPSTKIYIQSILPNNPSFEHYINPERIISLNNKIKILAKKYQIPYIDLYSTFTDKNDHMKEHLAIDGLHLTSSGYSNWKKVINNYVYD